MEQHQTTININKSQLIEYKHPRPQRSGFFNNQIWRVKDTADYLGVSIGHIYNLTSQMRIPYRKKGKLLYFIPSEIHDWVNEGNL